jgi:voltage-gated potassium channel
MTSPADTPAAADTPAPAAAPARGHPRTPAARLRIGLRRMFYGHRRAAVAFQAGLLALDVAAVAYFVASTFVPHEPWMRAVDLALGVLLALEFLGRMLAHRQPMHYLENAAAILDLVVIASLFASALGGNLGFLRVLRTVRLFRSYNVLGELKRRFGPVRRNETVILAALDLAVFVLMVSSLVFVTQHGVNPDIADFVDALYVSVATLTTTGFGDITLVGTDGKLLSIAMMIVGITLFLRLAQTVFRPAKVVAPCPQCGLRRHEADAVHCKACGHVVHIPHEGH